jgi:alcohol dehydrogenase
MPLLDDFVFQNLLIVIIGSGMEALGGHGAGAFSGKVLIAYGGGRVKRTGLMDRVVAAQIEAGASFVELGGVSPNPRLALVIEGIALCRDGGIGLNPEIGGESAIDSAKAIAMGVPCSGEVWDFFACRQGL